MVNVLLCCFLLLAVDVAIVEMSDSLSQPSLFYHLGVRESFSMTNNIILYCNKQESDLQLLKVGIEEDHRFAKRHSAKVSLSQSLDIYSTS